MESTARIDREINSLKVPNCWLWEGYVRRKITPCVLFVSGSEGEYDIKLIQWQLTATFEGAFHLPTYPPSSYMSFQLLQHTHLGEL